MPDDIAQIARRLLQIADRIRNTKGITEGDVAEADQLLWSVYATVFPGDEVFAFAVNQQLGNAREDPDEPEFTAFAELLFLRWLPVRVPGLNLPDDDTGWWEHGIRQIARMMLTPTLKRSWEVGTPREFAKFVGMTDQQFRSWRKANPTCWERIPGSKKIRCSRPSLDGLRNS